MARPRKMAHEKRDRRLNLRLTSAELAHLCLQAERAGLASHEYVRRRALGHTVVAANSAKRADPALISELNRVGVNLNQLAKATNMGRRFSGVWGQLAIELSRVLAMVMATDGS